MNTTIIGILILIIILLILYIGFCHKQIRSWNEVAQETVERFRSRPKTDDHAKAEHIIKDLKAGVDRFGRITTMTDNNPFNRPFWRTR